MIGLKGMNRQMDLCKLAKACYYLCGLLGLMAILGWKFDVAWMFQLKDNTAPTQFNAAICFVLISIAAWGHANQTLKVTKSAITFSLITFAIAFFTLIQYLLAVDLSIDRLLHIPQEQTFTSHPGRMAPNTALSFMLASSALFWLTLHPKQSKFSLYMIASLISVMLAISAVSVVGYAADIKSSYGWGEFTHMSLQAALGFCLLALGLLLTTIKITRESKQWDFHLSIIVGAVLFSMTLLLTKAIEQYQHSKIARLESDTLNLIERDVNFQWHVDVINFSKSISTGSYFAISQDPKIIANQAIVAAYVDEKKQTYQKIFSRTATNGSLLFMNDMRFHSADADRILETLQVEYTSRFDLNDEQHFALRMPVESKARASEGYLVLLVNYQHWLKRYVKPVLPSGLTISSLNVDPSNRGKYPLNSETEDNKVFPIRIGVLSFAVIFEESFYGNTSSFTSMVFWSGILLTILSVMVSVFAQSSSFKSKTLLAQITAKKRFEEELRKSHMSLKLATRSANLGIWTWDVESGELAWSGQMHEIYQTPKEIIEQGMTYDFWHQSVHPDDIEEASSSLQKAVENRKDWQAEFRLLLNEGEIKYIKATAICYSDVATNKLTVIGANQDITKEKELMQKLAEKSEIAEQNSLAKSKFLANMSHEIRTPMNAVLGIGDLLKATKLNSKQYQYMKLIMGSAQRLMELINDILDISKIEAGELSIEEVCFPLEEVLVDAAKTLATQAHQKGLDFHFFTDHNLTTWVKSDPVRLGQILTNLISNAIKFTEQGEIVVELTASPCEYDSQVFEVELSVADTGIGIAESKLETLFKAFSQADDSTTRKYGGTGLGLSIVKELVELLGGTVKVKSQLGRGTQIAVSLKLAKGSQESSNIVLSEDYEFYLHSDSNVLGSLNCLVIDSHPSNRKWLTDMLHSWQCNVTECESSEAALRLITDNNQRGREFEAMIVESNLNGESGFEFIKKLDELAKAGEIKKPDSILLLNASNLADDLDFCEKFDVKAHLVKPIKQSEVFNAIMSVLGKNPNKSISQFSESRVKSQQSLNILVAEDHEVNSFLVREILEKRGHRVTVVENGRLAVESNDEHQYDAILMDVQMPVMDGIEATEMIRKSQQNSQVCIVGLTARALKEDAETCIQAGMNYYLTKPVDPNELIEVIENDDLRHARHEVKQQLTETQGEEQPLQGDNIEFEAFDQQRALFTTESDIGLLKKMLTMASGFVDEAISEHQRLLKQEEWTALAKKIHKTKGMIASFSKESLTEELEVIINKVEKGELVQVADLVSNANQKIKRLKLEINFYLQKNEEA